MSCKTLKVKLQSGNLMPQIGFGTYQIRGTELIRDVLDFALGAGYRQIDTAAIYSNEEDIGKALKELLPKYQLSREDIFITSKLWLDEYGTGKALRALEKSVKRLDCGYLDLYLIHWPGSTSGPAEGQEERNARLRAENWTELVKGLEQGLTRDIGVSNYMVNHLKELLPNSLGHKPSVNQVEWHPHCHIPELKEYCDREGIHLQAYSSLGGTNNPKLMSDPAVVEIATKLDKKPAQVLLRWALQQGVGIIPKARGKERIEDNIALDFEISQEDINKLNNLQGNNSERYSWDPTEIV